MFPTIPNPAPAQGTPTLPGVRTIYRPDLLYSYELGDLVLTTDGDLVYGDGIRAWVQSWVDWLIVQQTAHPIYPRGYGVAHYRYMQLATRGQIEAAYTGRITRRARAEPGTRTARNFKYIWQDDGRCALEFEIVAMTGDSVTLGLALYV